VAGAVVEDGRMSTIEGFASVDTSYPGFADHLALLAGDETGRSS
jgi:5-enolpyruvylshikimate-3-phosphate synthase